MDEDRLKKNGWQRGLPDTKRHLKPHKWQGTHRMRKEKQPGSIELISPWHQFQNQTERQSRLSERRHEQRRTMGAFKSNLVGSINSSFHYHCSSWSHFLGSLTQKLSTELRPAWKGRRQSSSRLAATHLRFERKGRPTTGSDKSRYVIYNKYDLLIILLVMGTFGEAISNLFNHLS